MAGASLPTTDNWSLRRTVAATAVIAAVVAGFGTLYLLRAVLVLFFVALVLAIALKPAIAWFERRSRSHTAAVGGVYAGILVILAGAAVVLLPYLVDQSVALLDSLPQYYQQLRQYLLQSESSLLARLGNGLPEDLRRTAAGSGSEVVEEAVKTVAAAPSYLAPAIRWAFAVFAVVLLAFYWSLQEDRTIRWLLLLVPVSFRDDAAGLIEAMEAKVGAYIRGQVILCGIVGVMSVVAYWIVGLPYATVLGLLAGVLEALPYLGPILAAVPPLLVALTTDPSQVWWVLLASIVIQQVESYVLVPRVMDESVGVNPVVTLLAIAGFAALLGWVGAVLAIPLAAIIQLFIERYVLSPEATRPAEPEGRDPVSVLRYEAQQLEHDVRMQIRHKPVIATSGTDRLEETIESIARDLHEGLDREEIVEQGHEQPPPPHRHDAAAAPVSAPHGEFPSKEEP